MAPRLNKRQQREQEEVAALAHTNSATLDATLESSEGESSIPTKRYVTGFAALVDSDDDVESEDQQPVRTAASKKSKKKKKKSSSAPTTAPTVPSQSHTPSTPTPQRDSPEPSRKAKKAAKREKAKREELDDVDKALAELSLRYPEYKSIATTLASSASSKSNPLHTLSSLLAVSLQHLDSELEMRKFFGSKVISASKADRSGSPAARRPANPARSHLTRPQETWWPAKMREGLTICSLTPDELEDKNARNHWDLVSKEIGGREERWWTVEYSKRYKSVTMAFMQTVLAGDPENFWRLLGKLPWHADTLLQLSEVFRHREEYGQSVDFVDRALFTYERAFVGAFNFTSGNNRLDFDCIENRPFFLAVHRQVADLQRRGCPRTAFEFARLLFALDPYTDPHGALLHLDFLAIKTGMGQWLLDVWDVYEAVSVREGQKMGKMAQGRGWWDVASLPGWAYSRALALRAGEDAKGDQVHEGSTAALKEAITAFPSIVPLLADKADISLSQEVRGHAAFRIHTDATSLSQPEAIVHLLSHLYAQRAFSIWKSETLSAWFSATTASILAFLPFSPSERHIRFTSHFTPSSNLALAYSIYRHITVLESSYRRLFSFIPRSVLESKQLACDPLPPPLPARMSAYDDAFFRGTEDVFAFRPRARRNAGADGRDLERMVPDPVFRGQLQALFNAHPNLRERFPHGVAQFAQFAAQLPEEALVDLLMNELNFAPAPQMRDGGMPGGLLNEGEEVAVGEWQLNDLRMHEPVPVADEQEDDEDEEEDVEEEEEIAPLPVRLLRNIVGRFWGGGTAVVESSEEDDEDGPAVIDDGGVD